MRVRVDGQLTFNTTVPIVDAAVSGYGIAYVPEDLVSSHIAEGRLALLLDDWSPPFSGYHLYYPSRRQISAAPRNPKAHQRILARSALVSRFGGGRG